MLDDAPCSLSAPQRADAGLLQELEAAPAQALLHAVAVAKHSAQHQPATRTADPERLSDDVFGVQEMNHARGKHDRRRMIVERPRLTGIGQEQ